MEMIWYDTRCDVPCEGGLPQWVRMPSLAWWRPEAWCSSWEAVGKLQLGILPNPAESHMISAIPFIISHDPVKSLTRTRIPL